jgi:hypothetical protein
MDKYEALDIVLEILKRLIDKGELSEAKNESLYFEYKNSQAVEDLLLYIAHGLELRVYEGDHVLYLCPETGSTVFGWNNDNLRKLIPYVKDNTELYIAYFIIMTMITIFYPRAAGDTSISYIKVKELITEITARFDTLFIDEDLMANLSKELNIEYSDLAHYWRSLPDAKENETNARKNNKIACVNNICLFLQKENLISFNEETSNIFPLDRFKTIILNYYADTEEQDRLGDILSELEDKANATY